MPIAAPLAIVEALTAAQVERVRTLFVAYAASLNASLCFQDFDRELAELPGAYVRPTGRLLIALRDGQAVGCGALRCLDADVCEMKRLYVAPVARGTGLGEMLVQRLMAEARAESYRRLRLDTLPEMAAAARLYRRLGFRSIANYNANPIPGTLFFERELAG
jgi:putative acetyltransferase